MLAVVLGLKAGLRAGPLAGVLSALAGFVPAVVWELARGPSVRERTAQIEEKRAAALKTFESAGPRADAGVAGGWVAESGAAWLWRPEAEVVGFRSRPELGELVAWCVAGGRLGVRLVTEEGGSGKTRLALQLETELAGHGWRTLWVEGGGRARRSLRCAIAESPRCWWSIMPRPGRAWRSCWQRRRLPGGARMCAWCCWRAVPSVSDISDRLALPPPPTAPWPECVRFFLTLSQALARPDAFLPDLATALNNQSERLADLGRREEALAAIEEAATTYRALAQARPAVFAGRYASSLEAQAAILSELGRDSEAKAVQQEGTAIRGNC